MKFSLKSVLFGSIALGILATSFTALAIPPHLPDVYEGGNVWSTETHADALSNHGFGEYRVTCFDDVTIIDMHTKYTWLDIWSSDFLLFEGIARKEGDQVFMVGDDNREEWHNSRQWELTSWEKGYGHFQKWHKFEGKPRGLFRNMESERVSWMICDCRSLANYFSSVDINIDNNSTLESILSRRPECSIIEAASSEETSSELAK